MKNTDTHGAILGDDGAIETFEHADAQAPFLALDQGFCLLAGHAGEIIDVQLTLATEADLMVADHGVPVGWAGGGDGEAVEE